MPYNVSVHGHDADVYAHVRVELKLLPLPSRDAIHLGLGTLDRDAGLQPSDHAQPLIVTLPRAEIEAERRPTIDVRRHPRVRGHEELEIPGHDADDRHRSAVDQNRAAQHLGIAAEAATPEAMAHYEGPRRDRYVGILEGLRRDRRLVLDREVSAKERLGAQHAEEIRRDEGHLDLLRVTVAGQAHFVHVIRGSETLEQLRLLPVVDHVGRGHGCLLEAGIVHPVPDQHQPVRLVVGERPEQYGVDHAEDRRVRTDPQTQRHHRDYREARASHQLAPSVAQIV